MPISQSTCIYFCCAHVWWCTLTIFPTTKKQRKRIVLYGIQYIPIACLAWILCKAKNNNRKLAEARKKNKNKTTTTKMNCIHIELTILHRIGVVCCCFFFLGQYKVKAKDNRKSKYSFAVNPFTAIKRIYAMLLLPLLLFLSHYLSLSSSSSSSLHSSNAMLLHS